MAETAHLADSLKSLLNNPEFTDVTFECKEGETVYGHRAILIARCDYFKKVFQDSAKTTEDGKCLVAFPEVDAKPLVGVLEFLYGASFDKKAPWASVFEILKLADEYAVSSLVELCVDSLQSRVTDDNCNVLLEETQKHLPSWVKLYKAALNFYRSNLHKMSLLAIEERGCHRSFLKLYPSTIQDVFAPKIDFLSDSESTHNIVTHLLLPWGKAVLGVETLGAFITWAQNYVFLPDQATFEINFCPTPAASQQDEFKFVDTYGGGLAMNCRAFRVFPGPRSTRGFLGLAVTPQEVPEPYPFHMIYQVELCSPFDLEPEAKEELEAEPEAEAVAAAKAVMEECSLKGGVHNVMLSGASTLNMRDSTFMRLDGVAEETVLKDKGLMSSNGGFRFKVAMAFNGLSSLLGYYLGTHFSSLQDPSVLRTVGADMLSAVLLSSHLTVQWEVDVLKLVLHWDEIFHDAGAFEQVISKVRLTYVQPSQLLEFCRTQPQLQRSAAFRAAIERLMPALLSRVTTPAPEPSSQSPAKSSFKLKSSSAASSPAKKANPKLYHNETPRLYYAKAGVPLPPDESEFIQWLLSPSSTSQTQLEILKNENVKLEGEKTALKHEMQQLKEGHQWELFTLRRYQGDSRRQQTSSQVVRDLMGDLVNCVLQEVE
ncbi:hypothetical protein CYMTET_56351 [Cymbomonas tetramitiformis]|uniref:BTB domain-containing protein n=1 Tax=Cymbomonas tetramitiformis TaxID=36881 RepID=A0AAE0EM19_9CHLO|nr:hypothetical protein CYMTET_56351 [Cymbomonas tetramitiformis]